MRCLSTGLGVALGWPWVALCSPLSDFSFQLSAFQLLPKGGFDVALMCLARPVTHHASRITSGLPAQSRITNHESPPALVGSARPFDVGSWMFDVRCSVFTIMNPSPGPDALPLPIYEPIFIINCYGQLLWQALLSPYDGFYYAQYEAHYLFPDPAARE